MRSCSFLEDVGALLEFFWVAGGLIEYGVGFGLDSKSSYFGTEFHKHFYINIRPSLDHTALQTSSRGSLQLGQVLL